MSPNSKALDRREFVQALISSCPQALVISGLGASSYDLFAAGDRNANFYLWGAMGGAAAMGLGLAIAQPSKSVVVITGDGEQLMGLGALATIGAQQPANLTIVVLDNGCYGETGKQTSHTRLGTDLVAVARACSFNWANKIENQNQLEPLIDRIQARQGCGLTQVVIHDNDVPKLIPPRDGSYLKNRFRQELGFAPF
jgi:phosphonopyruvate decarboxylase